MMDKKVALELTVGEIMLLTAALGNTTRRQLHQDVAEDFGEAAAEAVLPETGNIFEIMMNDKVGPLHSKLSEKI